MSPAMGGTGDPSGTGSVQRTGKLGSPSLCPVGDKGHSDLGGTTMVMWVTPKHCLGAGRTLATRLSQCQGPIATFLQGPVPPSCSHIPPLSLSPSCPGISKQPESTSQGSPRARGVESPPTCCLHLCTHAGVSSTSPCAMGTPELPLCYCPKLARRPSSTIKCLCLN